MLRILTFWVNISPTNGIFNYITLGCLQNIVFMLSILPGASGEEMLENAHRIRNSLNRNSELSCKIIFLNTQFKSIKGVLTKIRTHFISWFWNNFSCILILKLCFFFNLIFSKTADLTWFLVCKEILSAGNW